MSLHQQNPNKLSDDHFVKGELKFLKEGNTCRLLDGRRTPGYIENVSVENAMFRWRITDFEDKGNYWDMYLEDVKSYQFLKESETLGEDEVNELQDKINLYDQKVSILIDEEQKKRTEQLINEESLEIIKWIKNNSDLLNVRNEINIYEDKHYQQIQKCLIDYMVSQGLEEFESKTAQALVLNPHASEWLKGMKIILAELNLVSFEGKIPRTDVFNGLGTKEKRKEYLIKRLAFVRALFNVLNHKEIICYRGMSANKSFELKPKTFTSWTLQYQVASEFAEFKRDSEYTNCYLLKRSVKPTEIFMTCVETKEMNEQYKEYEVVLFFNKEKGIY